MFNAITESILKAIKLIAESSRRQRVMPSKHPRYNMQHVGGRLSLNVARHTLSDDERELPLAKLPRKKVQVANHFRAHLNDDSRYSGAKLREIRDAGGAREKARRLRQMRGSEPLLIAAQ